MALHKSQTQQLWTALSQGELAWHHHHLAPTENVLQQPLEYQSQEKLTAKQNRKYANLSEKERTKYKAKQRQRYANFSEEERVEYRAKQRQRYANFTELERMRYRARQRQRYTNMSEQERMEYKAKQRRRYANFTEEQRVKYKAQQRERYANMSEEKRRKLKSRQQQRYATLTEEQRAESAASGMRRLLRAGVSLAGGERTPRNAPPVAMTRRGQTLRKVTAPEQHNINQIRENDIRLSAIPYDFQASNEEYLKRLQAVQKSGVGSVLRKSIEAMATSEKREDAVNEYGRPYDFDEYEDWKFYILKDILRL